MENILIFCGYFLLSFHKMLYLSCFHFSTSRESTIVETVDNGNSAFLRFSDLLPAFLFVIIFLHFHKKYEKIVIGKKGPFFLICRIGMRKVGFIPRL